MGNDSDLSDQGWNDRISSFTCSTNAQVNFCSMFEHTFFGGSSFSVQAGIGNSDLRAIGWNDRISSLIIETD